MKELSGLNNLQQVTILENQLSPEMEEAFAKFNEENRVK